MIYGARYHNLLFMGDSLTFSTGASAEQTYPHDVVGAYPRGRWFYNGGVGGNTSSQILTRYLALDAGYKSATLIIWAGRNNYTDTAQVKSDIAAMITEAGHSRYLVLSIINGTGSSERLGGADYLTLTGLNTDLQTLYGSRYVDVRGPLVAAGAPTGAYPDATHYAFDQPPDGVRSDTLHLNDAGYAIVAAAVYAKLTEFGW
jgi:lysophospholipase L1-like esterase